MLDVIAVGIAALVAVAIVVSMLLRAARLFTAVFAEQDIPFVPLRSAF